MSIQINHLKKAFGDNVAVDIPELQIHSSEILGLVGNNGAGKTTLFRLILDLLKADEGEVAIDGTNPAKSEDWKQVTGAYIDEGFLIDFLTIEEFTRLMNGEILGHKKLIRDFSAGNKQKIGIISALFNHPQTVILDEPFNFLDPSSQNILKRLLVDYNHATGATILISSHNLQHTVDISTRIALLEHGCILKDLSNEAGSAEKELEDYFNIQAQE